jgi:hypothetical protein
MFGYQRDGLIGQTIETLVTPRPAYLLALEKTEMLARFSTVAGEAGAADAERDVWGFGLKFYTKEGNWDLVGKHASPSLSETPTSFRPSSIHRSGIQKRICTRRRQCGISGRCRLNRFIR